MRTQTKKFLLLTHIARRSCSVGGSLPRKGGQVLCHFQPRADIGSRTDPPGPCKAQTDQLPRPSRDEQRPAMALMRRLPSLSLRYIARAQRLRSRRTGKPEGQRCRVWQPQAVRHRSGATVPSRSDRPRYPTVQGTALERELGLP